MTHISTLITTVVKEYLEPLLAVEFHNHDLGDFSIKVGRLQSDPERPGTNLMIHIGKPHDDKWVDMPAGSRYIRSQGGIMGYDMGDEFAIGEVGGGRTWLRRFSIEGSVFFTRTKDDRDTANENANIIRGIIESLLTPDIVLGTEDEFGERAYRLLLGQSTAQERGGPKSHIWDFWIYFTVETIRP